MIPEVPLLVILIRLVDLIPDPAPPTKRGPGRPPVYTDRLLVKALLVMIIRRLYSPYSLLTFLDQETALTRQLRLELSTADGQFASRRTWERRLAKLPDRLPGLIGALGRYLVALLQPWQRSGRGVALDSTPLRAKGGVWHKKHRDQGIVPHSSIDTEANWSKSGYHSWWYGWKLHLASAVAAIWIPLAAEVTVANTYDASVAPDLIRELPLEARYVFGDRHYNDEAGLVRRCCHLSNRDLVTTRPGPYPHTDDGKPVRKVLHALRSKSIEPFNGLFKALFECSGQVQVKGLNRVQLFILGAVLLYQIVLLYQFQRDLPLGKGIKPLLRAA